MSPKTVRRFLCLLTFASLAGLLPATALARESYLRNSQLRIGVDLDMGGGISYFSEARSRTNLLNTFDEGRLIQQSYYGQKDGSHWGDKPWRWNPVQGGDYRGNEAEILEWKNDGTTLYVKTRPRHWASGELLQDVVMEETITLEGDVAVIHFSCTYSGDTIHPVTHQETPAVFINAEFPHLYYYGGDRPWSGGELTTLDPGWPNEYYDITEHWAAFVNKRGWGVGVYVPEADQITTYRYEGSGRTGTKGDACSYFAPIRSFAFDRPMTFEYTAYLTLGSIEEIRTRFQAIADSSQEDQP
ncbi:hypothetical protein H5P28_18410 [Ruficoccus amylovorans]|uniref:Uncharacterized protein n=1 Tax=Ruficoccus amylovorans TaxID=1804625 RepID=A0A842HL51_9BACT|nr:hypothetical protein [Ruficoccus amylovorans]MBC2596246.1 hypothetical protein [Ruficoccus amylovorans]